ncbi:hypothetical protein C0J52_24974 [Blattella germanica]|nr:hypothetical protein C0J52_24974 [Blattella germanica]
MARGKKLRVFENKVLRKISGPKRDEETGEWRKLHNTEGVRRILEGKPEGKRPLENNINHDLREVDYTGDDWKTLAQDRDDWRAYVHTTMKLRVR